MAETSAQQLVKQAMQLHQRGELQQARELYAEVLEISPRHPDALHLYGLACHQQGDHKTAVAYIRQAIELVPDQPVLRNNLGGALCETGDYEDALTQLHIALDLRPDYAGAHQNLGSVYARAGDPDSALKHARKAVELDANRPEAWFDLGLILLDHVLLGESVDAFRKALALRPLYPRAATSLLYTLNLLPDTDPAMIEEEHCKVAAAAFKPVQTTPESAGKNERIRVGYVSGDFCAHAVNYFFEPVLEHQDKSLFETYCYSDGTRQDHASHRLQQAAQHWRDISAWGDDRVIEQVKSDGIDILVDLAGHTKRNRLGVFARKPAPCQLSWLGFPNTTGLDSMDYRVVDRYTVPGDEVSGGSEELLRLPHGFACFRPPGHAPAIQPAPVVSNGFVTLGCLHKLEKLNEDVIALWAQVLQENPGTQLLLVRDQLDDWQQRRLRSLFLRHGVAGDRLKMTRFYDLQQGFFDLFADIDILLDTFPWSGHTLACCALWMGVPVVSLYGDRHAGRMVASLLDLLELDELVAKDTESYARIVNGLCGDQDRLIRYRAEIRNQFEKSPLRDEKSFTKELETQYRQILKF
jgi:predicted O-linked N-acetylglucosamine transferase (SPINDLY family)